MSGHDAVFARPAGRVPLLPLLLALCALSARPLHAQALAKALDLTLGPSAASGSGAPYDEPASFVAAITFTPAHRASRPYAFVIGTRPQMASNSRCLMIIPDGGCAERYPWTHFLGVLAGLEKATSPVTFRAMVGPALFATSARGRATSGLGGQALLDVAGGSRRVAAVVAARGNWFYRFEDAQKLRFGSLELGLRLR